MLFCADFGCKFSISEMVPELRDVMSHHQHIRSDQIEIDVSVRAGFC